MDWRLFASTFALIFLAELGDKTQLAAMASAAGNKSTLAVFFGASAALVTSTLIAVAVGGTVQKLVPEHVIKTVAGILFLVFGVLLLVNAFRGRPAATAEEAKAPSGLLSRIVMEAAAEFEKAAADDYDALAEKVQNPHLRSLFQALADEERRHLNSIHQISRVHAAEPKEGEQAERLPRFLWAGGALLDKEMEILAAAIEQEKAKVRFYEALAEGAKIHAVRSAFLALADEERGHVDRLRKASC
jgi:rubrerythrin